MFFNLRKYISPVVKEKILNSMVYRVYSRIVLIKPEIRFSVELTTKCNARCRMCTRQKLVNNKCLEVGEMRKEVLDKVFTEMKKFKKSGYKVVFTPMGLGEPLMYSQIYKIIKKVRKMGIKVIVVTNGLLLNDTNIGLLLKSGVNEITVSLNADNKSRYKKLMGIDGYVIVKGNVKRLFIKRNRYSFNTDINIQYLGRVDDYNKENGYWKQYMKGRDKWFVHEFVNQAGLVKKKPNKITYPCNQPLFRIAIKINGNIYPCDPALYSGAKKFDSLFLGNVLDGQVYNDFCNSISKRYQIMKLMKENNYSDLVNCKICTTKGLSPNCFFRVKSNSQNGYKWI